MNKIFSFILLLISSPVWFITLLLVFLQDFRSPIYKAERGGKNNKSFKMIKIRTMIIDAENSGVTSTSNDDNRITKIGRFIRKLKIDELGQLVNIVFGAMNFVGPRPNTLDAIKRYSDVEKGLLKVKPGITDLSSIVFYDEGQILLGVENPDLEYEKLIRPWKSRISLQYISKKNLFLYLWIILLTLFSLVSRKYTLLLISRTLTLLDFDNELIEISKRERALEPKDPPGSNWSY